MSLISVLVIYTWRKNLKDDTEVGLEGIFYADGRSVKLPQYRDRGSDGEQSGFSTNLLKE